MRMKCCSDRAFSTYTTFQSVNFGVHLLLSFVHINHSITLVAPSEFAALRATLTSIYTVVLSAYRCAKAYLGIEIDY